MPALPRRCAYSRFAGREEKQPSQDHKIKSKFTLEQVDQKFLLVGARSPSALWPDSSGASLLPLLWEALMGARIWACFFPHWVLESTCMPLPEYESAQSGTFLRATLPVERSNGDEQGHFWHGGISEDREFSSNSSRTNACFVSYKFFSLLFSFDPSHSHVSRYYPPITGGETDNVYLPKSHNE